MKIIRILSLIVLLGLLFTNTDVYAATKMDSVIPYPMPRINLKYGFSPLPIYPPTVVFTATVNRIPLAFTAIPVVVEFYSIAPSLCMIGAPSSSCPPSMTYLGRAPINSRGQAIFSNQFNPGNYTVIAKVRINTLTIWSNQVYFTIY